MGSSSERALKVSLRTLAQCHSLAISDLEDDPVIRSKHRPFLLPKEVEEKDWISELELDTVIRIAETDLARTQSRLKVLVLYGSLRQRYVPSINSFPWSRQIRILSPPTLINR
jgi:arsenical resistance protein ArsH